MHRSSSYYLSSSSSSSSATTAAASGPGAPTAAVDVDQLPTYDPQSDAAKEALDASRANSPHTLVHVVPVVLLLWSLSTTTVSPTTEVGAVVLKKRKLMALKSESAQGWNGPGMMAKTEDPDAMDKASHCLMSSEKKHK